MKQPNRTGWTFPAGKIQGPKSDGFGPGTQPPDPVFPLETGRLVLREFRPEDKSDLLGFIDDPDQLKLMLFSLATEAEIDRFLDGAVAQAGKSDRTEWHWAVWPSRSTTGLLRRPNWGTGSNGRPGAGVTPSKLPVHWFTSGLNPWVSTGSGGSAMWPTVPRSGSWKNSG